MDADSRQARQVLNRKVAEDAKEGKASYGLGGIGIPACRHGAAMNQVWVAGV